MDNYFYNSSSYHEPVPEKNPKFTKYLIFSILEILLFSWIPGVLGLIFTLMADSDFKNGNLEGYTTKMNYAKIALIVGLILGIAVIMGYICFFSALMTIPAVSAL